MSPSAQHHAINYIEFTTTDIAGTKAFYEKAFSWNFQDYGPDYIAFDKDHAGIDGGFRKGDPQQQAPADSAPLIVLYSQDLKATQDAIIAAGGSITVPTFDFREASASTLPMDKGMYLQCGQRSSGQSAIRKISNEKPRRPLSAGAFSDH